MKIDKFYGLKIAGVSCCVPKNIIDNTKNPIFSERELKRFIKGTGIKEFRRAGAKQTCSDLGFVASRELLKKLDLAKDDIDLLVFITQSADYRSPATSHILSYRLGLNEDTAVFDVNLGCSGYVYGLRLAASWLSSSNAKRALLIVGDSVNTMGVITERYKNEKDNLLFGGSCSATVIEKANTMECMIFSLKTDGSRYTSLMTVNGGFRNPATKDAPFINYITRMDGDEIFRFSTEEVPATINEFLEKIGKKANDFDYVLFHQANKLMLETIASKINVCMDKVPLSLEYYGNTSSCSIPNALCFQKGQGIAKDKISLLCSGFGVGLSWGVCSLTISSSCILPIIESDEYFKEAY